MGRVVCWVGLSERRSVSRLFGWMNSWLLDGELVGVFVGKLTGVWASSLVCWSVDGLTGGWLIAQLVGWWVGQFVRRWDTDFCVGVSVIRWGGWSDAGWAPEAV